jgi:hypothetical protein
MASLFESLALLCVGSLVACGHTSTYGYQSTFDKQFLGSEDSEPPPVEARQLLASARTVAFYPPDTCLNTTPTETHQDKVLRARCGVLLSKLERDAERAGYEVVSWVNLRGNQRPIDYARDANVDVLFEINELSPQRIKASESKRKLAFFERSDNGVDNDLGVSTAVGQRCHAWAKQSDKDKVAGLQSTLDIKTVSVADGRARWHYRRTVSSSVDEQSPKVRFVGANKPNKIGQTLLGTGLALVITGAVFALVDEAAAGMTNPDTGMPNGKTFGDYPYYAIVAGGIVGVAGLGVTVVTGQAKPSPEDVLCLDSHVVADGTIEGAVAPAQGPTASHHTFNETTAASAEEALTALIDRLAVDRVSEFVAILTELRAKRPELSPPAAAPAATIDPPATPTAAAPAPVPHN